MGRHFPKGTRFISIDANPFDSRPFITESDIESIDSDSSNEEWYHVDESNDDTFFYIFIVMCLFVIVSIFLL